MSQTPITITYSLEEFINCSVVVGFVLALLAGAVKLFFPNFPS